MRNSILTIAAILLMASCVAEPLATTTEHFPGQEVNLICPVTITAVLPEMKTAYPDGQHFSWVYGDCIGVLVRNADGSYTQAPFTTLSEGPAAEFSAILPEGSEPVNFATYPFGGSGTPFEMENTENGPVFRLPAAISEQDTTNPLGGVPLIGITDKDGVYHFKTASAIMKFTILGLGGKTATLRIQAPEGTALAGTAILGEDDSLVPAGKERFSSITITPRKPSSEFYAFCFPGNIPEGTLVSVLDETGSELYSVCTAKAMEVHRNRITNIAPISIPETEQKNGTTLVSFTLKDEATGYEAMPLRIGSDGTVPVCLPEEISPKNLVIRYETDGLGLFTEDTPVLQEQRMDFSAPVTFTVRSSDGTEKQYTVTVHPSSIPVLNMDTPDGAPVTSKNDWMENAQLHLWTKDGGVSSIGTTSVKGRGNSTWYHYPKKSYNLKLDKKTSLFGMPKDKRWCLLANFGDRSKVRHAVGFALAKATRGIAWTPSGEYVELFLNGKYNGLYYLCEKIKISKDRVNIKEMSAGDITPETITGGYLLEFDTMYDEPNRFRSTVLDLPVMIQEPDEDVLTTEQMDYIRSYIDTVDTRITSGKPFEELIDTDSFIDVWMVKELVWNTEMRLPRSIYFHKGRNGRLTAGPVWDFDLDGFMNTDEFLHKDRAFWYKYLFMDETFTMKAKERWNATKDAFQNVFLTLDDLHESIRSAEQRDASIWTLDGSYEYKAKDYNLTFDGAHERMKTGLQQRWEWLDAHINQL